MNIIARCYEGYDLMARMIYLDYTLPYVIRQCKERWPNPAHEITLTTPDGRILAVRYSGETRFTHRH